jgi:hypothetical protein
MQAPQEAYQRQAALEREKRGSVEGIAQSAGVQARHDFILTKETLWQKPIRAKSKRNSE